MLIQFVTERGNSAPTRKSDRCSTQYATTLWQRTLGLMFREDFDGELIFKFKKPCTIFVHSFFMKFSIRIKFYNKNRFIKKCDMQPWQIIIVRNIDCFVEEKI